MVVVVFISERKTEMWPKTKVVVLLVASFLCDDPHVPTVTNSSSCGLGASSQAWSRRETSSRNPHSAVHVQYNNRPEKREGHNVHIWIPSRTYDYSSKTVRNQMSSAAFTGISSWSKAISPATGSEEGRALTICVP